MKHKKSLCILVIIAFVAFCGGVYFSYMNKRITSRDITSSDALTVNQDGVLTEIDILTAGDHVVIPYSSHGKVIKAIKIYGNMKSIDFSHATAVEEIIIDSDECSLKDKSKLKKINVSKNKKLRTLKIYDSYALKAPNLEKNVNLEVFISSHCDFRSLDITKNIHLKVFDVSFSPIKTIDVSKNKELEDFKLFHCEGIKELDVSSNQAMTSLTIKRCGISKLDLTSNKRIKKLFCTDSNLNELLLEGNDYVRIDCTENNLTQLDLRKVGSMNANAVNEDCKAGVYRTKRLRVDKQIKIID